MAEAQQVLTGEGDGYRHYNPVSITTTDTLGVIILGILAMVLVIALLRLLARNRALEVQLARQQL
jgi:hypothetical protein